MQGAGARHGETGGSGESPADVAVRAAMAAMQPEWLTYDHGIPYCALCGRWAMVAHLESYSHMRQLASHSALMRATAGGGQPPGADAGAGPPAGGGATDDNVAAQLLAGVLPGGSGDPLCYRWDGDGFHCRLCREDVTVGHLSSIAHRRRVQVAPRILQNDHEVGHLFRAQRGGQLTWPGALPAVASPPATMAGAPVVASPPAPVVATPVVASPPLAIGWAGQVPGGPPLPPPPPPPRSRPPPSFRESSPSSSDSQGSILPPGAARAMPVVASPPLAIGWAGQVPGGPPLPPPPPPPGSPPLPSFPDSSPSSSDSQRTILPPGAAPASLPAEGYWTCELRWNPTSGPETGESRGELSDDGP